MSGPATAAPTSGLSSQSMCLSTLTTAYKLLAEHHCPQKHHMSLLQTISQAAETLLFRTAKASTAPVIVSYMSTTSYLQVQNGSSSQHVRHNHQTSSFVLSAFFQYVARCSSNPCLHSRDSHPSFAEACCQQPHALQGFASHEEGQSWLHQHINTHAGQLPCWLRITAFCSTGLQWQQQIATVSTYSK